MKLRGESEHHRRSHLGVLQECEALRMELSRMTSILSEGEASSSSLKERMDALTQLNLGLSQERERIEIDLAKAHATLAGELKSKLQKRRAYSRYHCREEHADRKP